MMQKISLLILSIVMAFGFMLTTAVPARAADNDVLWPVPSTCSLTPGSAAKLASNSRIYLVGFDGALHAFPNEATFFSWFGTTFNEVMTISSECFATYKVEQPMLFRPGAMPVKFSFAPTVYVVAPGYRLVPIANERVAMHLFGENWKSKIVVIDDTLAPFYFIDKSVMDVALPSEGMLLQEYTGTETFAVLGGKLTQIETENMVGIQPAVVSHNVFKMRPIQNTAVMSFNEYRYMLLYRETLTKVPERQNNLDAMFVAMNKETSVTYSATVTLDNQTINNPETWLRALTIELFGKENTVDCTNQQAEITTHVSIPEIKAAFTLEMRALTNGNDLYIRLSNLAIDESSMPAELVTILKETTGKWISIALPEEMFPADATAIACAEKEKQYPIMQTLEETDPLIITKYYGTETMPNGLATEHYGVALNPIGASVLLETLFQTQNEAISSDFLSEQDMMEIVEEITDSFASASGELWVRASDNLPHRILFTGVLDEGDELVRITYDHVFTSFGDIVQIEKPADAISFEALLEPFMGMMFDEAQMQARDSKRLSDLLQLQTALELYYTDNGAYPITESELAIGEGNAQCLGAEGFAKTCDEDIYMGILPSDPGGFAYIYEASPLGESYTIRAYFEGPINTFEPGLVLVTPSGIIQNPPENL